jgi:hypothetical protein
MLIFLLPFCLFAVIYKASYHSYWGLNTKYPQVSSANSVISNCVDDLYIIINICTNRSIGATKTAVLIGDSHAGHFSVALTNAANDNNWDLIYWRVPLVPLDEVSDEKFRKWIKETKPDLLIISQYWRSESDQAVIKGRILELKGDVKNILFFENNPIFPDISRFRLSGYLIAPFEFPKSYPISRMDFRDKGTSNELSAWAKENRISTMNFDSLFCDGKNCSRYSEIGWLYTDANHLSLAGAELAYPQFSAFLKSFQRTR